MTDERNSPSDQTWTVRRILEWTSGHLEQHGSDSPRLDAEILLAHARGCERIALYTHYDDVLSDAERATMRALVQRRAKHEPVAYLVGHREFFGLDFRVTPEVLIPRPDTETLVVELIERLKEHAKPRLLDVCTGSGCIGIAASVNVPAANAVATDVSAAALEIARGNAAEHGVADRFELREGDLLSVVKPDESFDAIASNPPYIPAHELETLQADVRLHEPRAALDGGLDGLDFVRRLIEGVPRHLVPRGSLLIEIDATQADAVTELLESAGCYEEVTILKDLAGLARVACARKTV